MFIDNFLWLKALVCGGLGSSTFFIGENSNTDETNLPVLLFIHGGNNQTGTSSEIDARKLAVNANCIVVSINYRLGALGFNSLPALKTGDINEDSGNYTLLDIAKSLD